MRSSASALAGLLLAAGAVGAGWVLWRAPPPPPTRPAAGDVVLSASADLAEGPFERRLLAPGPCVFAVEVTTAADVRVTLGPPLPSTPGAPGGPDPAGSTAFRVSATGTGRGTQEVRVYGAGIQVLRVEPDGAASHGKRTMAIVVRRRAGP